MFLLIIIFCLLLVFYLFGSTPQTDLQLTILLCFILFSLIVFFWYKERDYLLKKTYISHSNLLVLGFLIVFFQVPLEYLARNVDLRDEFFIPYPVSFFKTVHILSISFLAFLIGYLISLKIKPIVRRIRIKKRNELKFKSTLLLSLGSLLSFFFYLYVTDKSYFMGGYSEIELTPTMAYANVLYSSITTAYFIQKAVNLRLCENVKTLKKFILSIDKFILITSLIYCLLVLSSGDRGPVLFISVIYFGAYIYATRTKLKLKVVFPIIVIISLFIMTLGMIRAPFLKGNSLVEKIKYVLEAKSNISYVSPATIELAGSFKAANVVVAKLPDKNDYFYGHFFLKTLTSVFPGISRVFLEMFYSNDPPYLNTSASYITYLIQGTNPRYGDGTTAVSDVYLDFGLWGCVFFFLLFGLAVRNMEEIFFTQDASGTILSLVISFSYLASAIGVGRDSMFQPFIVAVRVLIFIYMNNLLVKGLKR